MLVYFLRCYKSSIIRSFKLYIAVSLFCLHIVYRHILPPYSHGLNLLHLLGPNIIYFTYTNLLSSLNSLSDYQLMCQYEATFTYSFTLPTTNITIEHQCHVLSVHTTNFLSSSLSTLKNLPLQIGTGNHNSLCKGH